MNMFVTAENLPELCGSLQQNNGNEKQAIKKFNSKFLKDERNQRIQTISISLLY